MYPHEDFLSFLYFVCSTVLHSEPKGSLVHSIFIGFISQWESVASMYIYSILWRIQICRDTNPVVGSKTGRETRYPGPTWTLQPKTINKSIRFVEFLNKVNSILLKGYCIRFLV